MCYLRLLLLDYHLIGYCLKTGIWQLSKCILKAFEMLENNYIANASQIVDLIGNNQYFN